MWEFIASAAAGLNAGAGLQAALAGAPTAASDSVAFTRFASRTRILSLLMSVTATAGCINAYYAESRGALWLAAAAGVGVGIPFSLLLMAPPTAVVGSGLYAPPSPRVRFAVDEAPAAAAGPDAAAAAAAAVAAGAEGVPGSAFAGQAGGSDSGASLSAAEGGAGRPRRPSLMYSKSGLLVSPSEMASAWTKKFWFSAALNLTAFACMMTLLSTGKDAATYGYAPF